jgi:hypothetical protein
MWPRGETNSASALAGTAADGHLPLEFAVVVSAMMLAVTVGCGNTTVMRVGPTVRAAGSGL